VPTVVRDRKRRARCVPDRPVNAGNSRSVPDSLIHRLTGHGQTDPVRKPAFSDGVHCEIAKQQPEQQRHRTPLDTDTPPRAPRSRPGNRSGRTGRLRDGCACLLIHGSCLCGAACSARPLNALVRAGSSIEDRDAGCCRCDDRGKAVAVQSPGSDRAGGPGCDARHRAAAGRLIAAGQGRGAVAALDPDAPSSPPWPARPGSRSPPKPRTRPPPSWPKPTTAWQRSPRCPATRPRHRQPGLPDHHRSPATR
jgi:hypothetical protein